MKLKETLVFAGYEPRDDRWLSPYTGKVLEGGKALYEFYDRHFPGLKAKIEDKGNKIEVRKWDEDPFAA